MLASIIITNYNYGKYLGECLRSCLYQSLENSLYEVIVIDDFSSDNSSKVIEEYVGPHKNLRVINNKKIMVLLSHQTLALKMQRESM